VRLGPVAVLVELSSANYHACISNAFVDRLEQSTDNQVHEVAIVLLLSTIR
jgi:hypothetical protein